MASDKTMAQIRKRVFEIVNVGSTDDSASRIYDLLNTVAILVNLAACVLYTFEQLQDRFAPWLLGSEAVTVAFFAIDYGLRLWTAKLAHPSRSELRAVLRYACSFSGIIDLLSFLPYYLPIFFPTGAVAFRMFRIVRIFRLFRVNSYYDSLSVISQVLSSKRQQLFSSVFIILVLMLAASLCMYSLEHEAQPDVFTNAFSGIWWAVSTLLTVGYGDIYPITALGKAFSIIITFLGVGMVAIPTGIISAGFVDQYSRIKRISEYAKEGDVHFIKVRLGSRDRWAGQTVQEIGLPRGTILAVIQRKGEIVVPRGNVTLLAGDTLVLGAELYPGDQRIDLKEIELGRQHPWNGQRVKDLDISRKTILVMIHRKNKAIIPNGDLVLREGDKIILYTQLRLNHASTIQI